MISLAAFQPRSTVRAPDGRESTRVRSQPAGNRLTGNRPGRRSSAPHRAPTVVFSAQTAAAFPGIPQVKIGRQLTCRAGRASFPKTFPTCDSGRGLRRDQAEIRGATVRHRNRQKHDADSARILGRRAHPATGAVRSRRPGQCSGILQIIASAEIFAAHEPRMRRGEG